MNLGASTFSSPVKSSPFPVPFFWSFAMVAFSVDPFCWLKIVIICLVMNSTTVIGNISLLVAEVDEYFVETDQHEELEN